MSLLAEVPTTTMSPKRRRTISMFVILTLLAGVVTAAALRSTAASSGGSVTAGPSPAFEQQMFDMLNAERTRRGLAPLRRVERVDNVAREWSQEMAVDQRLRHRPSLSTPFTGNWRRLGENVGVGYGARSLHNGFMASSGHRANVLGDFQYVGVGVALAGSNAWVTFNFVKGDPSVRSSYARNPITGYATGSGRRGPYYDTSGSVHEGQIEHLDARGLTISCATYRYCPEDGLRRAEMAEMLVRAFDLPPARERFVDVSSSHPYADAIGALAAAGITVGCNPPANDRFCPEEVVSRQQMASFFVRALELRPRSDPFRDVPSSNVHSEDIGGIAASGITIGCDPPRNVKYCPGRQVTRAEMASFIARALQR